MNYGTIPDAPCRQADSLLVLAGTLARVHGYGVNGAVSEAYRRQFSARLNDRAMDAAMGVLASEKSASGVPYHHAGFHDPVGQEACDLIQRARARLTRKDGAR